MSILLIFHSGSRKRQNFSGLQREHMLDTRYGRIRTINTCDTKNKKIFNWYINTRHCLRFSVSPRMFSEQLCFTIVVLFVQNICWYRRRYIRITTSMDRKSQLMIIGKHIGFKLALHGCIFVIYVVCGFMWLFDVLNWVVVYGAN